MELILYTHIYFYVTLVLIFAYNLKLIFMWFNYFLYKYYELILSACDNFLR
jgi:hypothetical protein